MKALTGLIADAIAGGLALAVAGIFPSALPAQSAQTPPAIDRFARLQSELRRTHESGDAAAYLSASQSMYAFLNGSPRALLQLMSADTFAGKLDEALQSFAQLVVMGQANENVLKAKSFDPLRVLPRYQNIHAAMTANTAVQSVPMGGKYALSGIDGLYAVGNLLIATQNGSSPERVVRLTLDGSRVVAETIIERGTPTLGDPTHGVVVGDSFYYIANSGWDALDEHGNLLEGKSRPAASVRRAKVM